MTPGRLEHLLSGISVRLCYCGFRSAGGRLLWSQSVCVCVGLSECVCTSTSMSENAVEKTLISIKEERQIREERDDNDGSG